MPRPAARGWFTTSSVLSIVAGLAVFVALIWRLGPREILDGLLRVRWVFPLIVALGGLRFLVRAWAWSSCLDAPHRLRLREAFAAVVAGDALGNATPLGPVVGEPAKVAFARAHVPIGPGLTALAIENLFYTLSTAAMIAAGMLALLFAFDLPARFREFSAVAVLLIGAAIAASIVVLRARPALLSRWLPLITRPGTKFHASSEKLQSLEQQIYSFSSRRRVTVLQVSALEISFHALGVLETHLTMWVILGSPPPILISFILETASRLITVVFKFVPLQLGVAEVGLAGVTELLRLGTDPGATFSLVRKARIAVWALLGAWLLIRRGITPDAVLRDQHFEVDSRKP